MKMFCVYKKVFENTDVHNEGLILLFACILRIHFLPFLFFQYQREFIEGWNILQHKLPFESSWKIISKP